MNQKMELLRENLNTPIITTGSTLLTGGLLCLLAGVVTGIFIGMIGKGLNVNVALGSYNGYGNHHNGCEKQNNSNNNELEEI